MALAHAPARRRFLRASASAALCLATGRLRAAGLPGDPFTLGVAAGFPGPRGAVLWTRLAPLPGQPDGGLGTRRLAVDWEVAEDATFGRRVAGGTVETDAAVAHAVHVEVDGLAPARHYHYRFHADGATSAVGRFRTAPAPGAAADALRFAFASCQHFEHGHYAAHRHIAADDLDLVLFLGDYIYERSWGEDLVRHHRGPEPRTLEAYRAHYAQYRADADLQAAHAASAWLLIPDDHEVQNDYANLRSQDLEDPETFRQRRAAAYQAYYEHQPLPRAMRPRSAAMAIHRRLAWGALVEFNLLDTRQFRTPQPCPKPGRGGSNSVQDCAQRLDPTASMLGAAQERWLLDGLGRAGARWNVVAQTTLMAQADSKRGAGQRFYSDAWDGYPAARRRLLDGIAERAVGNPVVLGGDVHAFWVTDLKRDFDQPASATVASEFVTTSISSRPPPEEIIQAAKAEGAHIHHATGSYRGYTRVTVEAGRLLAEQRTLDDVRDAASPCRTRWSWVVEDGRAGAQPA